MNEKILLVEDDPALGQSVHSFLTQESFQVQLVTTLAELKSCQLSDFDILILDWMLPDGQGIEYLKFLPTDIQRIPIIMLTARTELIDKVLGLELGANDYLTKPFEPRELIARIRVQLRMAKNKGTATAITEESNLIIATDIEVNLSEMKVTYKGEHITLTKMEYSLLKLFVENPKQVFSRDEILTKVWGYKYPTTRTVDTHILQLRNKFHSNYFETVHGIGYRFRAEPKVS
ncbi:MAG: response regulator transcription factor [Candidatus Cloacimonetes bacterium]|nr:response regulator transcription factor [Candidatus Cloacimonadota bacterium]